MSVYIEVSECRERARENFTDDTDVCQFTKYFVKYWLSQIPRRNVHPLTVMSRPPLRAKDTASSSQLHSQHAAKVFSVMKKNYVRQEILSSDWMFFVLFFDTTPSPRPLLRWRMVQW